MNTIEKVKIEKFWDDKEVNLKFKDDVNFLIGVNGSGKTTIINLIAATLKADFVTLDRFQFKKITVTLKPYIIDSKTKKTAFIEVEKADKENSPYPSIIFKIKRYEDNEPKKYLLDELEESHIYRVTGISNIHRKIVRGSKFERDVNVALEELVNVSWLSIHRTSSPFMKREERSFESSIDLKIEELQIDLVKYFSQLNRKYTLETEKFQKFIFESLIDTLPEDSSLFARNIDSEKEKDSLKQIFALFKLNQNTINTKLENYFKAYDSSLKKINQKQGLGIEDLSYLIGIRRIHSVAQEWNKVVDTQKNINKPKETFLIVINSLLQRKELIINEKNELIVKTQSGKIFPLTNLSSGEKQLLIILGQSLLQEQKTHIYIADEPELSLHVEWQEKLVISLKSINPNSQIIFATHSPDIVGQFESSVIKIEETIK
ncbi:MAG TPA: AAA family ATPase [Parafilimonas sp.]|nr:AAA family ATPase [Parafilimonas sp.]